MTQLPSLLFFTCLNFTNILIFYVSTSPVCGDNGKTYSNLCQLEVEKCVTGADIGVDHEGACQEKFCSRTQFMCESDRSCVSYLVVCDGFNNCQV